MTLGIATPCSSCVIEGAFSLFGMDGFAEQAFSKSLPFSVQILVSSPDDQCYSHSQTTPQGGIQKTMTGKSSSSGQTPPSDPPPGLSFFATQKITPIFLSGNASIMGKTNFTLGPM